MKPIVRGIVGVAVAYSFVAFLIVCGVLLDLYPALFGKLLSVAGLLFIGFVAFRAGQAT